MAIRPALRKNINLHAYTIRRENGPIPNRRNCTFDGCWVVRDRSGIYCAHSDSRSDLRYRFDDSVVIA